MLETSQQVVREALALPTEERAELAHRLLSTLVEPCFDEHELPGDLLQAYHRLLDKKFSDGLSLGEEGKLKQIGQQLDEADARTPLEQDLDSRAKAKHQERMSILSNVLSELHSLKNC